MYKANKSGIDVTCFKCNPYISLMKPLIAISNNYALKTIQNLKVFYSNGSLR